MPRKFMNMNYDKFGESSQREISGKFQDNPRKYSRRENFRGNFSRNSGKFREIPGNFPSGKFPGKLSGKISGKFIFSSAKFVKIHKIGQNRFAARC